MPVSPDLRPPETGSNGAASNGAAAAAAMAPLRLNIHPSMLTEVQVVPFSPAPESHLLDLNNSHETPAEEFRTLRTRLNHLQSLQPLHTIVVTSPSPAEGKTFTAVNLALAQSHLAESSVLLGDFDLRRPIVHNLFQIDRAPGLSDFLTGQCTFAQAIRRVEAMNLYLLPAGSPVKNPLELLNMRQAKLLFEELPAQLQLGRFRYAAAVVLRRCQPAFHHGRRHDPGGEDRFHHVRQRDPRHAVALREQRPRHRGQRRARFRTLQQVHLLLLQGRIAGLHPAGCQCGADPVG